MERPSRAKPTEGRRMRRRGKDWLELVRTLGKSLKTLTHNGGWEALRGVILGMRQNSHNPSTGVPQKMFDIWRFVMQFPFVILVKISSRSKF